MNITHRGSYRSTLTDSPEAICGLDDSTLDFSRLDLDAALFISSASIEGGGCYLWTLILLCLSILTSTGLSQRLLRSLFKYKTNKTIHPKFEVQRSLLLSYRPRQKKFGLMRSEKGNHISRQSIMESSISSVRVTNAFATTRTRPAA